MKQLKYILLGLLFMSIFINGYSQPGSTYFYYYKGEKVLLELDTKTIALSFEGEQSAGILKSSLNTMQAKLSPIKEDYSRNTLVSIDQRAMEKKSVKTYYAEITTTQYRNQMEYNKQIEAYRKMSDIIMASPCFQTKKGKKMGLSNNFYVKLKDKKDVDLLYDNAERLEIEVLGHNKFMPLWFTLSCGKGTRLNALEAANFLYETGLFESTEPAFMYHDLSSSSDPYFPNQWGLKNTGQHGSAYAGIDIKAEQAWTVTTGSPNIRTAVFDHGFEMDHPDLQANTFGTGYDATTGTSPSQVRGEHGTACAGIVGAVQNNNEGVSGVAANSRLISVSIDLQFSDPPQSLADGFNWAWQNGADVISNSWGGYTPSSIIDDAIANTLTNGRGGRGTVVVFAAGNEDDTNIRYPGNNNPLILVVGALSPCGERKNPGSCDGEYWWGSCYGTQLDVIAPGVLISTTDRQGADGYDPSDYTQSFNGTSSACPLVAGVAALILSVNPNLTVQQVTDIIEQSAQKTRTDLYNYTTTSGRPNGTWNEEMGYGLVDAYQAVLLAGTNPCVTDLTIRTDVIAPNTDNQQASATITAVNTINSGATAVYHAGTTVKLTPGFVAVNGSSFKAYIEGCTGNYLRETSTPASEKIVYNFRSNKITSAGTEAALNNTLLVNPTPFTDKLTISYHLAAKNHKVSLEVYSVTGVKIANLLQKNNAAGGTHSIEWNANDLPGGIYLIILVTDAGKQIKKVVKW